MSRSKHAGSDGSSRRISPADTAHEPSIAVSPYSDSASRSHSSDEAGLAQNDAPSGHSISSQSAPVSADLPASYDDMSLRRGLSRDTAAPAPHEPRTSRRSNPATQIFRKFKRKTFDKIRDRTSSPVPSTDGVFNHNYSLAGSMKHLSSSWRFDSPSPLAGSSASNDPKFMLGHGWDEGPSPEDVGDVVRHPEAYYGQDLEAAPATSDWDPPDSWAVARNGHKKGSDVSSQSSVSHFNLLDFPAELDVVYGGDRRKSSGVNHCIRIIRRDGTFATVLARLDTTTEGLIQILCRKFFLSSPADYTIVLFKNGLSRELLPLERPFLMQSELLRQAGYEDSDHLEGLGREDNSHVCRFILCSGLLYDSTMENISITEDFERVDLSNRNLKWIPIPIFKHAGLIKSLNLSRNLSIDVPLDFIQACSQLEVLAMRACEIRRINSNFTQAKELRVFDLSSNQITSLECAQLSACKNLMELHLKSNLLRSVPKWFEDFEGLTMLDLSFNEFETLPLVVTKIQTLQQLNVSFNKLKQIPKEVFAMKRLRTLTCSSNQIAELPPDISMSGIMELDLRYNHLTNVNPLATMCALEYAHCDYNLISTVGFIGPKLRHLSIAHNPLTSFDVGENVVDSLEMLDLCHGMLTSMEPRIVPKIPNLRSLKLDYNRLSSLPAEVGSFAELTHLSVAHNLLGALPASLGLCTHLSVIDLHSNNIKSLPSKIWELAELSTLNLSSNLLTRLPDPPQYSNSGSTTIEGALDDNTADSYSEPPRKSSAGILARSESTMIGSLTFLYLGDNRLTDDCFEAICLFENLRVLNLSYNDIFEVPQGAFARLGNLKEVYISGNELTVLPNEEFDYLKSLNVIYLNKNKLQAIPAELARVRHLGALDVGQNNLKYNVTNWPYDWNWNYNPELYFLNLSGNKRLEIHHGTTNKERSLTSFQTLTKLRSLGLMDVTLTIPSIPDETEDRRVRLVGSDLRNISYGVAEALGSQQHIHATDLALADFQGDESQYIFAIFDGIGTSGPNKLVMFMRHSFSKQFDTELNRLAEKENPCFALRRTFLSLNKEIGLRIPQGDGVNIVDSLSERPVTQRNMTLFTQTFTESDRDSGVCSVVVFVKGRKLYVAGLGNCNAVMAKSDGDAVPLTRDQCPRGSEELGRLKSAGGYLDDSGRVNGKFRASRAVGCLNDTPAITAAPSTVSLEVTEADDLLIIANDGLWDCVTYQTAADVARTSREDPLAAAQKLRDFAIAYGASRTVIVMVIGVHDIWELKYKPQIPILASNRPNLGLLLAEEDYLLNYRSKLRRGRFNLPEDSTLARLSKEVSPPTGMVALVFTDIKNSTFLWETQPEVMRSAMRLHNSIIRRQLRTIGGYEVKNEGDAFMVCFPTVTSALLWCFTVQTQLLNADWPAEFVHQQVGCPVYGDNNELIYNGLSVRMGINWGVPVCEIDPITKRMDYFGPVVNRASRISAEADGGEITISSDFFKTLTRLDKFITENEPDAEIEGMLDPVTRKTITRDFGALHRIGFEIFELGERKLKGLESLEWIALVFPMNLVGRYQYKARRASATELVRVGGTTQAISASEPNPWTPERQQQLEMLSMLHRLVARFWQLLVRVETCAVQMPLQMQQYDMPEDLLINFQETVLDNLPEEGTESIYMGFLMSFVHRLESAVLSIALRHRGISDDDIFAELLNDK